MSYAGLKRAFLCVIVTFFLVGCAHNDLTVMSNRKIAAPKIIALDAPQAPWAVQIELQLRKAGFKVLRYSSTKNVTQKVSDARSEQYREASTRYVLVVAGSAPVDNMHRCFGGGYNFDFITAELVDTDENETLFNVTASGYSENCPPMSGHIYASIAKATLNAWQ